jgi:hypothetical protein
MSGVDIALTIMPFLAFALGAGGLAFGKWQDTFFRAKMKRMLMKKDVVIIGIVNQDKRSLRFVDILPEYGVIKVGDYLWIYDGSKAYRASTQNNINRITVYNKEQIKKQALTAEERKSIFDFIKPKGKETHIPEGLLVKDQEKMFEVKEDFIRWQEGVPVIYVDEQHLTPLDFEGGKSEVTPIEISPVIGGYVDNQILKNKQKKKDMDFVPIVMAILVLVAAGVSYIAMTEAQKASLAATEARDLIKASPFFQASVSTSGQPTTVSPGSGVILPPGSQLVNGTIVVNPNG